MPKKMSRKRNAPPSSTQAAEAKLPISKQTAGGVTGAVLGGMVAGPLGALAGGLTGAIIGDESAKGKKPVKRAVEAVRAEVTEGRVGDALKSATTKVGMRIKSMRKGRKSKKKAATKKSASSVAKRGSKKAKSKPATKKAKTAKKKGGSGRKKKRAKKRR